MRASKQKCPLVCGQMGIKYKTKRLYSNLIASQHARILELFYQKLKRHTLEFRAKGIMHPGGRIMELRRKGYKSDLHWATKRDLSGIKHRIGIYVFQGASSC